MIDKAKEGVKDAAKQKQAGIKRSQWDVKNAANKMVDKAKEAVKH